ncbi:MAG: hypothetical protein A3C55_06570 [Gammaproteobacteria bacterium RIFCSPHIGHO2_02_FULL_42_13]|nr:MAG: hypothetical protein A3C55_06570 [Gammaproteobacteria bacterium RIFCSPHIGHO2_02_FULL_42_13]OGT69439.1 MAG: hypothetical protein A3H43_05525 [Gammaproteobacteria bacterium RIFCSPLOWO2_02_FULL_42_9]
MKYRKLLLLGLSIAIASSAGCDRLRNELLKNPITPAHVSFFVSSHVILRDYCQNGDWPSQININIPDAGITCKNDICFLTPPSSYFKQQSKPETIHIMIKPQHCANKTDCIIKTIIFRHQHVLSVDYTTFKRAPNVNRLQQEVIHVTVHADDYLLNDKVENLKTKTDTLLDATALVTCKPTFQLELQPHKLM